MAVWNRGMANRESELNRDEYEGNDKRYDDRRQNSTRVKISVRLQLISLSWHSYNLRHDNLW